MQSNETLWRARYDQLFQQEPAAKRPKRTRRAMERQIHEQVFNQHLSSVEHMTDAYLRLSQVLQQRPLAEPDVNDELHGILNAISSAMFPAEGENAS